MKRKNASWFGKGDAIDLPFKNEHLFFREEKQQNDRSYDEVGVYWKGTLYQKTYISS